MSGLRHDALHDTWVIIAPQRERRPSDQRLSTITDPDRPCPFCPGAERETPPAVLTVPAGAADPAGSGAWRIRIFPNRYPAVDGADGRHEVVVVTPDHDRDLADLRASEAAEVLTAIQSRMRELEDAPGVASVLFFLNAGAGAGASLAHAHGQLLATPVVPGVLRTELAACAAWRRDRGTCLLCDLAAEAAGQGRRIAATPEAVLLAPLASRFSWETLILPRRHGARFGEAAAGELAGAAALLVGVCRALRRQLGRPAYNLVLHTAPPAVQDFHWHLELLPRLAPLAGFETGTGFFINPVEPHAAAAALRRAWPDGSGPRATGEDTA